MLNKELIVRLLQTERKRIEEEAGRWAMLEVRANRLKQPAIAIAARQSMINCNRLAQDCVVNIAALARL